MIRTMPAQSVAIAMQRRLGPNVMIAFSLPSHGGDEDALDRESNDDDGDVAMEAVCNIVHRLHEGGPSAVRDIRQFISSLEGLCEAHMDRDPAGMEDAAHDVYVALRSLTED